MEQRINDKARRARGNPGAGRTRDLSAGLRVESGPLQPDQGQGVPAQRLWPTASTCTRRTPGAAARPNSACTPWRRCALTPFYTDRERAALAWTDALTLISHGPVPEALHEEARRHFSEKELVDLTLRWSRSTGGTG